MYNPEPTVVSWGMERFSIMLGTYFLCAISDAIAGALRGLGHSFKPTITTILGTCGLRIVWVCTVFPHYRTMSSLIVSYPISWSLIAACNGVLLFFICRRMLKEAGEAGIKE